MEAHIDTLVSEQASFVLNQAGLAYLFGAVQQHLPKQVRHGSVAWHSAGRGSIPARTRHVILG